MLRFGLFIINVIIILGKSRKYVFARKYLYNSKIIVNTIFYSKNKFIKKFMCYS